MTPPDNSNPSFDVQQPITPSDAVKRMIEMLKVDDQSDTSPIETKIGVGNVSEFDDTSRVEAIVIEPVATSTLPAISLPSAELPKSDTPKKESRPETRPELRIEQFASEMNRAVDKTISTHPARELTSEPPWTLEQFFNGEIDLDVELTKRFPTMPMMANVHFRTLGTKSGRRVATLNTQDNSASLVIDADMSSKVIQMSFTLGSMLTLRFSLAQLSDMDRTRWVDLMRRDQGGLAFLWGPNRWASDYLICISRKTNFYAFSPNNFEAGIRLTPPVMKQLLDWLDEVWSELTQEDDDSSPLLTW
jgi:hypothetical protein